MVLNKIALSLRLFVIIVISALVVSSCSEVINDNSNVQKLNTGIISDIPFSPYVSDWPHSQSDITPDPRVKYGRLQNGLRYAILPVPDGKGVVSIQMNVSVGFKDEPENLYGIAHVLEHMAFRGAKGDKEASIIHDLQTLGAGFGFDLNGFTQYENTFYRVNLVSNKSSSVKTALYNFSQLVRNPNLTQENLELEKKVVLAELKMRDTLQRRISQSARQFQYPDRAREKIAGIGTEKSLAAITLMDLEVFFKTHYKPENVFLIVAGGVNAAQIEDNIAGLFSQWAVESADKTQPVEADEINLSDFPVQAFYQDVDAKTQLSAIENTPSTLQNDTLDFRQKKYAEQIALSIMRTRLKSRIENDSKVSWINFSKTREKAYDIRKVKMGAEDYVRSMTLFEEERLRAIEHGFTSAEIEYALKKQHSYLETAAEEPTIVNAWAEANRLRAAYNDGRVYNSRLQKLEAFNAFSKTTSEQNYHDAIVDIWQDFTPRYWTQSYRSMAKTLEKITAARKSILDSDITKPLDLDKKVFQKTEFAEKGQLLSRDVDLKNNIHRLLFENGTRLNYQQRKTEPNNIEISVNLRGELANFIDRYAAIAERATAFSRADIKGTTKSEMDRVFVGQEASFRMSLVGDSLVLSASTRPQDLEAALDVIVTFITDVDMKSKFHEERFEANLKNTKTASANSPVIAGTLKLASAYSGDPPTFRSQSSGSYALRSKVMENIKQIIDRGSVEVGVAGDFDPEILEELFASTLGALPERPMPKGKAIKTYADITHIGGGVTNLVYSGTDKQMALFYCWPNDMGDDDKEEAISTLINSIFHNRIIETFRQELGVSYSPQIIQKNNTTFPAFKYKCFAVQIAPEDEDKVHDNFIEILDRIREQPITKTELIRTREPILSLLERYMTSNEALASLISYAYSKPEFITRYETILSTLNKVKLKTLNRRFPNQFDKSKLHVFRVQHQERSSMMTRKVLKVKIAMGDSEAKYDLGKILMRSSKQQDHVNAMLLFERAASQGNLDAHFEIGKHYARARKDLEKAAEHLELSKDPKEGAFLLANLYFRNPDVFPDVSEARIMELFILSSESGFSYGQKALAQRYKDGSITPRDEVKALKWVLISSLMHGGTNTNLDTDYIRGFKKALSDSEQKKALEEAQDWIKNNSKRLYNK